MGILLIWIGMQKGYLRRNDIEKWSCFDVAEKNRSKEPIRVKWVGLFLLEPLMLQNELALAADTSLKA